MKKQLLLSAFSLLATLAFGQWSTLPLSEAKFYTKAIGAPDKAIFIGGSLRGFVPSNRVEIYNFATSTWKTTNMSVARILGAAIVADDVLYIGGGLHPQTGAVTNVVNVYDLKTDQWKTQLSLSLARASAAALQIGKELWFAGGYVVAPTEVFFDIIDIYNPETGAWRTEKLPVAQIPTATVVGNKAIFYGGVGKDGPLPLAYIYDIPTKMWSTTALSTPRFNVTATTVGPYAIFAGGSTNTVDALDAVDIYNSTTNTWTTAKLSTARAFVAAGSIGDSLAIFAGGGEINFERRFLTTSSKQVDIFNIKTGLWSQAQLSQNRTGVFGGSDGKRFFVGNGWQPETNSFSNTADVFSGGNTVSVSTLALPLDFQLAPNPATDVLRLQFGQPLNVRITVLDLTGRLVLEQQVAQQEQVVFPVAALPAGTYVVEVQEQDGGYGRRLWVRE